ncbi:MAG: hypothetical protein R3F23_07120 [Verrucomicrobiia bacterium]
MEWTVIIVLLIINAALGGQQLLNNLARTQADKTTSSTEKNTHNSDVPTSGLTEFATAVVLTWWRELFKLSWSVVAVVLEAIKGRALKEFWPGWASVLTVSICSFTGIIENIGFFSISRYSPHLWVPFISVYIVLLPVATGLMFGSTVRKEHWFGTLFVLTGLVISSLKLDSLPQLSHVVLSSGGVSHAKAMLTRSLDWQAVVWLIIINLCLCSQQILNNKSVQLAKHKVSSNAFVLWREVFKFGYATLAIAVIALIEWKSFTGYFTPQKAVIFAIGAGLTGYIYSWGFFALSKYPVHVWVPYTNLYVVVLPFLSYFLIPGVEVKIGQIIGTCCVGLGLVVGLSDYSRHKIEKITDKQ